MRIIRYLTSGAIGIGANLGLYYLLVHYAELDKIVGSIIAVTCSTIVGFYFQKYWTFGERHHARIHVQFALYALVAGVNIGLNTVIVFLLITFLDTYFLLAQAIAAGIVAIWSFFVYRDLIFKVRGTVMPVQA